MRYALLLTAAAVAVAACGSTAAAAHSPGSGGASPRATAGARNGASGQITQLASSSLVLKTSSGAANVAFTGSTTIVKTSTGSVSDIVTGACVIASGQPNAAGGVTAMTVTVSSKVNGACTLAAGRGGGAGGGAAGNRPGRGGASPNPNFSFIRGQVTAVDGNAVTVQPPSGAAQTFTVSDNARVTASVAASASQLAVGQCLVATGQRDSSGTVHANTMSIVPAGPSGCQGGFPGGGRFGPGGRPSPGSSPSQQ